MRDTKLAKGRGPKLPIQQALSPALPDQAEAARSAGKKKVAQSAAKKQAESVRLLSQEPNSKSNPDKLVCRYCCSDDLAPSFIKRRDRRCRTCFSQRYGSAAKLAKPKSKKMI